MKCEKCGAEITEAERMEHLGHTLCEDCYIDALSPARACDPWAVHTAKSCAGADGAGPALNDTQKKILDILTETGGCEPGHLVESLKIKPSYLERELATLRHMEKIRGRLENGKKTIILW